MTVPVSLHAQRGATLVVGLIMLVLITLVVTSAFLLSTGNLRAVGNMQFRNEAIAAANRAIELKIGSDFAVPTAELDLPVDLTGDGQADYFVDIATPTCIRATVASPTAASSLSLGAAMTTSSNWNTIWDIDAVVNDATTGAAIRIRQGVRVLLTQAQKNAACV